MRNVSRDDRSSRWRAACWPLFLVALALIARPVSAQQDGRFEVLTIPPANAGTCLPPLLRSSPSTAVQQGKRLVIKSLEPGSSREITTMSDGSGETVVYSERTSVTLERLRTKGAFITAAFNSTGLVFGFRMDTDLTVPDSVLQMQDVAAIQRVIDAASGTMDRRDLDGAEQERVRSMLEFIRKRCP